MGLHLCFELDVPRDTPIEDVVERVRQLHQVAVTLPFDEVSALVRTNAGKAYDDAQDADSPLANWFRFVANCRLASRDELTGARTNLLPDAVGFAIKPGDWCEAATFGLAWVPPSDEDGDPIVGEPYIWHWHTVCKTQYASNLGDDHLIRCHTSLVALLDHAATLGFDITVRDEAHYWETRDVNRLLDEVRQMNEVIARVAGVFHDAIGDNAHVGGAIFKHPEFEQLESRNNGGSGEGGGGGGSAPGRG